MKIDRGARLVLATALGYGAMMACSGQPTLSDGDASEGGGGSSTGGTHATGGSISLGGTNAGGAMALGGNIGIGGSAFSSCNSAAVCSSSQVPVRFVSPALGQVQCACVPNPCSTPVMSCDSCARAICSSLFAMCANYMPDSGQLVCAVPG
jgi:hypothetical protein